MNIRYAAPCRRPLPQHLVIIPQTRLVWQGILTQDSTALTAFVPGSGCIATFDVSRTRCVIDAALDDYQMSQTMADALLKARREHSAKPRLPLRRLPQYTGV